jgi:hypothetical protein
MKKAALIVLALFGAAVAAPAGAQSMDPIDAVKNLLDPGPAAAPPAPAAAPAQAQKPENKKFSRWWRNRQIERGPGSLRPGHHRRLLRRTVPQ